MRKIVVIAILLTVLGAGTWHFVARPLWFAGGANSTAVQGSESDLSTLANARPVFFAKRKDVVIGYIDVEDDYARLQQLPVARRHDLLLTSALRLALEQVHATTRFAGVHTLRIHVVRILDRDEYAKGNVASMIHLATIETSMDRAQNQKAGLVDRVESVDWKDETQ